VSFLYCRGRKYNVYIGYKDESGITRRQAIGFRLGEHPQKKDGEIIFPREVTDYQKKFDSEMFLGLSGLKLLGKRSIKISRALDEFLETQGSGKSNSTKRGYRLAVKKLTTYFGDVPLSYFTEERLFEWRQKMLETDSEQSVATYIRSFSPLFNWALRKGYLNKSPLVKGFKLNPPVPPPVVYSDSDLNAILKKSKEEDIDLHRQLRFMELTGFRVSETCGLQWKDIDMKAGSISVLNKSGKWYDVFPIDELLKRFLKTLPTGEDFVFKYRNRATVGHYLKDVIQRLKLNNDLNVHAIRKTFASRLVRAGVDFAIAHKLMRHRNVATTIKYYVWFGIDTLRAGLEKGRRRGIKT